jgi:hypothetical protein
MTELSKGYLLEELLRRYFIKSGYYTVRGVPFVYDGFEVTDIDIWLYDRPSSVSRHRIIVDCKNRNTPKAVERIFWTKGLQDVLAVDQAIVATTDKRPTATAFGREHNVLILDGTFLGRLQKSSEGFEERLTEEQFVELLAAYRPTKEGGDWKGRIRASKRPLIAGLGYNAINLWLSEAKYFAEQAQIIAIHREIACRVLYLLMSYIAIAFDFVMKDLSFSESAGKLSALNDGLRHGSQGAAGTKHILGLTMGLIEQFAPEQRAIIPGIRERFNRDLDALPTKVLAEYFAKAGVAQELFTVAKDLEAAAYATVFVPPDGLTVSAKGIMGVAFDFWGLDRKKLFQQGFAVSPMVEPTGAPAPTPNVVQGRLPGLRLGNHE